MYMKKGEVAFRVEAELKKDLPQAEYEHIKK